MNCTQRKPGQGVGSGDMGSWTVQSTGTCTSAGRWEMAHGPPWIVQRGLPAAACRLATLAQLPALSARLGADKEISFGKQN